MESFTTMKGFNSISDVDIQTTIQQNIIGFLDWGFINKGGFTNVKINQTDIRLNDKSKLRPVNDPNFTNGRVWATHRMNLVWESGLHADTQPIQISGVYVNGDLKTPTTTGFEHYVDYKNGNVVFNTPLGTGNTVRMEYSYKSLLVTNVSVNPIFMYAQSNSMDISSANYPVSSGDWALLGRQKVQFPLVSVEVTPRATQIPIELGGTNNYLDIDVIMHVISEDELESTRYASFISAQKDKTIWMYNLTMMNKSGAMPLTYLGTKSANPMTYEQLVRHSEDGGFRYNKLQFREPRLSGPSYVGGLYHTPVRFTMSTTFIS